jgi:hypothetical protein
MSRSPKNRDLNRAGPPPFNFDLDSKYAPENIGQQQGIAHICHIGEEWTIVAFWDRSADQRFGSNSAFIVEGRKCFDDVLQLAKANFPTVMARFDFPIVLL